VADCVFQNHEEVDVVALYRDPVHDFGFFRYDVRKVKFLVPEAISLRPDKAFVGQKVRVVGNDAGTENCFEPSPMPGIYLINGGICVFLVFVDPSPSQL
tara:strand:+ start:3450 stop:3746 length:297 start_codon:yes stop_codon:yes gene_type:complete